MRNKYRRRFLRWIAGLAVGVGWKTVRIMDWKRASNFGTRLGRLIYYLAGNLRRIVSQNIDQVYGDTLSATDRKCLEKSIFQNLSRYLLQSLKIMDLTENEIADLVDLSPGLTELQTTLSNGRSAMIVTGHYSNWELFAARIAQIAPLTVLARVNDNPAIQKWIDRARRSRAIEVVDRDNPSAVRILRSISTSGGRIVGILMDQDTRVKGLFSPFLGRPAFTPSGPAAIALKDWFDVYVGFLEEQCDGRYILRLSEKLNLSRSNDSILDVQKATDLFNELISQQIRREPSQWVWIHRRWRRKAP